jgi:hypothetical protein
MGRDHLFLLDGVRTLGEDGVRQIYCTHTHSVSMAVVEVTHTHIHNIHTYMSGHLWSST